MFDDKPSNNRIRTPRVFYDFEYKNEKKNIFFVKCNIIDLIKRMTVK